jgi:hypothetical protein
MKRIPQDEFDRIFDSLLAERIEPTYYMGFPVEPLNTEAAAQKRYFPLLQIVYWLDKQPSLDFKFQDMELVELARLHIRTGRMKSYGPSWRFDSAKRIKDVILDGEVIPRAEVFYPLEPMKYEDTENPLVDIFEFADWFRGLNFKHLSLPENWPMAEHNQAIIPAPESGQPEPAVAPRFNAKYEKSWSEVLKELALTLHGENHRNANAMQAWNKIKKGWKPSGYGLEWNKGMTEVTLEGEKPINLEQFKRKWNRLTKPAE